jgi:hypothetical protein
VSNTPTNTKRAVALDDHEAHAQNVSASEQAMKKRRRRRHQHRTVEQILAEKEALLEPCLRRGFSRDLLARAFIVSVEMAKEKGEEIVPLPDFFRAIARGEFDFLLKDQASGQSLN